MFAMKDPNNEDCIKKKNEMNEPYYVREKESSFPSLSLSGYGQISL